MKFCAFRCTPSARDRGVLRRGAALVALASGLIAIAALPAVAGAGTVSFGSSMRASATNALPKPVDTAFWATAVAGGGRAAAPAKGRITTIQIKGCAVQTGSHPPITAVRFQTLHPRGGNNAQVYLTSGPFNMPICGRGGSPTKISTFHPVNLCASKGDHVAFNDVGGFAPPGYPGGVSYKVLGAVNGSSTATFTGANRTNNGNTLSPRILAGNELMMRMTLGTGRAAGVCR